MRLGQRVKSISMATFIPDEIRGLDDGGNTVGARPRARSAARAQLLTGTCNAGRRGHVPGQAPGGERQPEAQGQVGAARAAPRAPGPGASR